MLLLVALLAIQAQSQQAPRFPKEFPHPTGENGLEEYVQALDYVNARMWPVYMAWQQPEKRMSDADIAAMVKETRDPGEPDEPEDPKVLSLRKRLNGLTMLQVYREEEGVFRGALELVAAGNSKPIAFPEPPASYAEGMDFGNGLNQAPRALTRMAAQLGYGEFSEGHAEKALQDLSECTEMGDRMGRGNYIGYLTGISAISIALAAINDQLDRLSLADAEILTNLANGFFRAPTAIRDAAAGEFKHDEITSQQMIAEMLKSADKGDDSKGDDADFKRIMDQLKQLNTSDRDALYGRMRASIQAAASQTLRTFDAPENTWIETMRQLAAEKEQSDQAVALAPHTLDVIVIALSDMFQPDFYQGLVVGLRIRAQMRLLRLHARVIQFRWEMDRLPKSLEEMQLPAEETYDPLSNQPFVYELSNGKYRLYSKGVAETGIIEMRYKRVPGATKDPTPPP